MTSDPSLTIAQHQEACGGHLAILYPLIKGMVVSPANGNAGRDAANMGGEDGDCIHGYRYGEKRVPVAWGRQGWSAADQQAFAKGSAFAGIGEVVALSDWNRGLHSGFLLAASV